MSKPLIDEIVCAIVDSFTDGLRWDYYNNVILKDPDFDVTAYHTAGSPEEVTREIVFQYTYNKVWKCINDQPRTKDYPLQEIFLT